MRFGIQSLRAALTESLAHSFSGESAARQEVELSQATDEKVFAPKVRELIELTRAAQELPQLIVLDVMMPGLDGLEALRQLKNNPATRAIPVVVLSAKGHSLTKVEAELAGAVLFLAKPFSPNQLLGEVRRILTAGSAGAAQPS